MRFPPLSCLVCQPLKTFLSKILHPFILLALVILNSCSPLIFFYSFLQQAVTYLSSVHWDFCRCLFLQMYPQETTIVVYLLISNLTSLQNEVLACLLSVQKYDPHVKLNTNKAVFLINFLSQSLS